MTNQSHQPHLLDPQPNPATTGLVTVLGQTFANDAERRDHFTELLRQKLGDPAFRAIEGFPIGTDEAILALSDPPYYTACPNPWLAEFTAEWEADKEALQAQGLRSDEPYHREPFAADVSEGKNDPIYNAHSYHTKVPHKAIMRYILHYTEPGDIVFDGFCGTGMTGVAAQLCGDRKEVESLGYRVADDGMIYDGDKPFSRLGARRAVLNDLSPAATFIAYNYNTPVDVAAFEREAKRILKEVEAECGWMYKTTHSDGRTGKINYTVWSDVFVCPQCTNELVFWEAAVDKTAGKVRNEFPCLQCGTTLTKRGLDRAWATKYDTAINQTIRQARQVPVLINYSVGKKRFEKEPDTADLALIEKIEASEIPYWFPTDRMMEGQESRRNDNVGLTHTHHFYTRRNLLAISAFRAQIAKATINEQPLFVLTSSMQYLNRLCRLHIGNHFHRKGGTVDKPLEGTLYFSSIPVEVNVLTRYKLRSRIGKSLTANERSSVISTNSASEFRDLPDSSVDYMFIDPPFGANLNYSELNSLWEAWLSVSTNIVPEAIENRGHDKSLHDYRRLISTCFLEAYRLLKPGRWMTVEFSNTNAAVWNSIQTALMEAGFIASDVSALDKKKGSFKAVTTTTAVKQDLVISAYKPNGGFTERFPQEAQTEAGVWDFIRTHLRYLPITKEQDGVLQAVPERDPRLLYDQLVAYYVRHGYPVPLGSQEFQQGLAQRFSERDGMVFLPEQTVVYDRARLATAQSPLQEALFVSDEASAIGWLRSVLKLKPQIFADINPQFMQQLGGWRKNEEQLDLRDLLEQNFLRYDGRGEVPSQIHAYLSTDYKDLRNLPKDDEALRAKAKDRWYVPDPNKAADLEKLRERHLLREFETYREAKGRKLKIFRLEAMRAGFKRAWQEQDYETILTMARKIPDNVLQEDPKLLMWTDMARTRTDGGK